MTSLKVARMPGAYLFPPLLLILAAEARATPPARPECEARLSEKGHFSFVQRIKGAGSPREAYRFIEDLALSIAFSDPSGDLSRVHTSFLSLNEAILQKIPLSNSENIAAVRKFLLAELSPYEETVDRSINEFVVHKNGPSMDSFTYLRNELIRAVLFTHLSEAVRDGRFEITDTLSREKLRQFYAELLLKTPKGEAGLVWPEIKDRMANRAELSSYFTLSPDQAADEVIEGIPAYLNSAEVLRTQVIEHLESELAWMDSSPEQTLELTESVELAKLALSRDRIDGPVRIHRALPS